MKIIDGKDYYTEAELTQRLGKSSMTLFRWRKAGTGPSFVQLGQTPLYAVDEVRAWIAHGGGQAAKRGGRRVAA
jgi:predicted DNA-binding transcriptional regulator AlpA